jgi:hypothetical protein
MEDRETEMKITFINVDLKKNGVWTWGINETNLG